MGFKKILVAIDYSPLSQVVFDRALGLAKSDNSELMLFHSVTADTVTLASPYAGEFGISPQFVNQAYQTEFLRLDQQIKHVQVMLQHYHQLATQQGVAACYEFKMVEAGQGLCQTAQKWGADLIVMGRRGRTGIREALLGSVSNYVLHHASCAVLVMQSPLEERSPVSGADSASMPAPVSAADPLEREFDRVS